MATATARSPENGFLPPLLTPDPYGGTWHHNCIYAQFIEEAALGRNRREFRMAKEEQKNREFRGLGRSA